MDSDLRDLGELAEATDCHGERTTGKGPRRGKISLGGHRGGGLAAGSIKAVMRAANAAATRRKPHVSLSPVTMRAVED